jgi:hypothetical protein
MLSLEYTCLSSFICPPAFDGVNTLARILRPSSRSASRMKKKAEEEARAAEEAAIAAAKSRAEANRQMLNDLQKSMLAGGGKVHPIPLSPGRLTELWVNTCTRSDLTACLPVFCTHVHELVVISPLAHSIVIFTCFFFVWPIYFHSRLPQTLLDEGKTKGDLGVSDKSMFIVDVPAGPTLAQRRKIERLAAAKAQFEAGKRAVMEILRPKGYAEGCVGGVLVTDQWTTDDNYGSISVKDCTHSGTQSDFVHVCMCLRVHECMCMCDCMASVCFDRCCYRRPKNR